MRSENCKLGLSSSQQLTFDAPRPRPAHSIRRCRSTKWRTVVLANPAHERTHMFHHGRPAAGHTGREARAILRRFHALYAPRFSIIAYHLITHHGPRPRAIKQSQQTAVTLNTFCVPRYRSYAPRSLTRFLVIVSFCRLSGLSER